MSFATGEDVMRTVEALVGDLATALNSEFRAVDQDGEVYLAPKSLVCRFPRNLAPILTSDRTRPIQRSLTPLLVTLCRHSPACRMRRS